AQESSLYTASDAASNKRLSRMSSFAKSFNSEDPSAFGTFSNNDELNSDYSLENAWDALVNNSTDDNKSPARLSNSRLASIPNHFFDGRHNLSELYLDRNSLRDLSEELLKLTKLEILDLSNNCISEIHP
ncbi:4200_t:CDS:1, partial [Acaulospora colombiana]